MSSCSVAQHTSPPIVIRASNETKLPVLQNGTIVVFLHLLKTGGTSLSRLFAAKFSQSGRIFPGSNQSEVWHGIDSQLSDPTMPSNYSVLYAHEGWSFLRRLAFPHQVITILRHPIEWIESVWATKAFPDLTVPWATLDSFVASKSFDPVSYYQSYVLSNASASAYVSMDSFREPPSVTLAQAIENLRSMLWFGFTGAKTVSIFVLKLLGRTLARFALLVLVQHRLGAATRSSLKDGSHAYRPDLERYA